MRKTIVHPSPVHGRGVFARRRIAAGERILEYKGERLSWKAAKQRYAAGTADAGHTFFFRLSDGDVIDGSRGGNSARWINHACAPNCTTIEDGSRVFIEASVDIDAGQEILIDYQLHVDGRRTAAIKSQYACRCGQQHCRGTMLAAR